MDPGGRALPPGADRDEILIGDDNERLVDTLCAFAEDRGYATRAAHTGREGLSLLREHPADVLLLDLVLPDMDGVSVMREAQRAAPGTDIVMITGHATLESAIPAVEAGASGYVLKPLELPRLDALLARVLERRRLRRENARLERLGAERLREAEALLEVSGAVTAALDLPEALRRICRTLARLTGADTAAAYLHDPSADLLLPTAGYHLPKETVGGSPIPLRSQGFYLPVWESRRPVWSDDIPADPRFGHELFRALQPRSGALLPLLLGDEVAGAFYVVWWRERRRLAERELTLLEHVSAQASLLLRNVRLYEQAAADRRRLAALNQVSRRLSATHDDGEILSLIVEEAPRLLRVEAAGIRLLEGDELVLAARTEAAAALVSRPRIKVGESLSGRAVSTGQPVTVEELGEDARFDASHRAGALALGFRSFLGAPMTARGRPIGALNVYSRARRRFSAEDIGLLTAFADHASLAIEKARLLGELETGRALLERLHGVVLAMQESPEPAGRLRVFVEAVREVMGFDRVSVFLSGADASTLTLHAALGDQDAPPPTTLPVSPEAGPLHAVLLSRRPLAVLSPADLAAAPPLAPEFRGHPFLRAARFVVAPVMVGDRVIGVATADNKPSRRRIPVSSVEPLGLLCQQLGAVLEEARLHAETRAQQTRLAEILESTSDGIMLIGRQGTVEAANRRAGDLLGFDVADVIGLGLGELLEGYRSTLRGWDAARTSLLRLLDTPERVGEGDLELIRQQRIVHWVARPALDAGGRSVGLTLTFQDVTQEREVSRMKSDFVSFVTHQLRTPLAGIRWLLELAQEERGLPAEAGSLLRDAQDANRRLISLVNDLLDISRLESGKLAVTLGPVDLGEVTRSVLAELEPLIRDRGHRVAFDASGGLSPALADPTLVRQVLLNLLSNAVKYTPAGGAIDVRLGRAGCDLVWAVRDTGIGIPPEGQSRLFEKFYRADNAATLETEGTGLGLYLVRLIVERLGGRVWCESEVDAGATFTLTLPPSQ